jgi:polygalacturonase
MELPKFLRLVCSSLSFALALSAPAHAAQAVSSKRVSIDTRGALGDGATLNTKAIQAVIDELAATGGGTIVVPKGEFLSGALFLKGGINLELLEGAVLKGSKNFDDYPVHENVRFEGHFQKRIVALLNVEKSDHFRLTGPGTIDGNGEAFWPRQLDSMARPRLCAIRDSRDVIVSGVKFKDSASWNLHLYNCQDSVVENCRFEIPDKARGPSTDGVDIDSSQNILVKGCYFSVNDDCVCLKGNRYDGLNQEPKSPPVRNVRVENCTFVRGHGALTLGTEAQSISDVEMKDCVVKGNMPMLRIKLRPDTPNQDYRNVWVHDIRLESRGGEIVRVSPMHGTKVPPLKAPISKVSDIRIENISGQFGTFGTLWGGGTATVSDITLRNIQVKVTTSTDLNTEGVTGLKLENVSVQLAP